MRSTLLPMLGSIVADVDLMWVNERASVWRNFDTKDTKDVVGLPGHSSFLQNLGLILTIGGFFFMVGCAFLSLYVDSVWPLVITLPLVWSGFFVIAVDALMSSDAASVRWSAGFGLIFLAVWWVAIRSLRRQRSEDWPK
jgi:hypothetical protein